MINVNLKVQETPRDTDKVKFIQVISEEYLDDVRQLFTEYAGSLNFDLCFQNFEKELSELPGEYAPPNGCIILAIAGIKRIGCVALRKIDDGISEMKRLYVQSAFRGKGIGRDLAVAIINEARKKGYRYIRLDTVPLMEEAIELYRSLGFKEIHPYRYNPITGAKYMELIL